MNILDDCWAEGNARPAALKGGSYLFVVVKTPGSIGPIMYFSSCTSQNGEDSIPD